MNHLWSLVQRHIDEYGTSEAQVAQRIGVSKQALTNWKRGLKRLPERETLERLAGVVGTSYDIALEAALRDAGYLSPLAEDVTGSPLISGEAVRFGAQRLRDLTYDHLWGRWMELFTQRLTVELEYARRRRLPLNEGIAELQETLEMISRVRDGEAEAWRPAWKEDEAAAAQLTASLKGVRVMPAPPLDLAAREGEVEEVDPGLDEG